MLKILVKRHSELAKMPFRGTAHSAGMDLYSASRQIDVRDHSAYVTYDTGLSFEISDPNYYLEIVPRSSLANYDLFLANHVGIIDWDYRGTVKFKFRILLGPVVVGQNFHYRFDGTYPTLGAKIYEVGERIGQMILKARINAEIEAVSDLGETERGEGGYGSTGNE